MSANPIRLAKLAAATVGAITLPLPVSTLDGSGHLDGLTTGSDIEQGTRHAPTPTVFPSGPIRYIGSWYAEFYNHIYFTPPVLTLIDPDIDVANPFFIWNASLRDATITGITGTDNTGLVLQAMVGDSIDALKVIRTGVIVTNAAGELQDARYVWTFDNVGPSPFEIILQRTNLIDLSPEKPITETVEWKSEVLTARNGNEQRIALRQFPRITWEMVYIYQDDVLQADLYDKMLTQALRDFAIPLWHNRIRLLAPILADATTIQIDTTFFDVTVGDQLMIIEKDTSETFRIQSIAFDKTTLTLPASVKHDYSKSAILYLIQSARMPEQPERQVKHFGQMDATIQFEQSDGREIFIGHTVTQEIAAQTKFYDRVRQPIVWTMDGFPILHERFLVDDETPESFNWNFEVVDFDTGPITRFTGQIMASVNKERKWFIKNLTQKYYWNYVMQWLQGQRRAVWLPSWQDDLVGQITSISGVTITINNERYADRYPASSSHCALWIKYNDGWVARRVELVAKDGDGNTVLTLTDAVPDDYPVSGPHNVGFLVLSRGGSDQVQFEHHVLHSFMTTTFTSTQSALEEVS